MSSTLLLVDDEPSVTAALSRQLHRYREDWRVLQSWSVDQAWQVIHERPVDLVVLDVAMPGKTGFELLEDMASENLLSSIPVVMLTGHGNSALKRRALEIGAGELLNKPVETIDLVARIGNMLRLKAATDRLKDHQVELEGLVAERTLDLEWSRLSLAVRLAKIAEMRDEDTGTHVVRVGHYAEAVAKTLGLDPNYRRNILLAAPMHDIGKIAIPDAILLKRGALSNEEWAVMRTHCELGANMLREEPKLLATVIAEGLLSVPAAPAEDEVLQMAARIALCHHEKWNGQGYPRGLRSDGIPLEARIVSVVDAFDALTTNRPYRTPVDERAALEILASDKNGHFDARILDAFIDSFRRVCAIRLQLVGGENEMKKAA